MTHDRQPLGQNGRSETGPPVTAVVELFCDCCDTPMAPTEVQWRLGPDDVTQVPFCQRCVQPGLLGAWRRLSLLQQLFVVGFLLVALVIAAVIVRQVRSPHRQIGVLMERARTQRLAGENRQAYETLAAALALEPNNAAACRELGFLYHDVLERPAEAVAWLQRALAADPRDAVGRLALVRAALAIASEPLAAAALHDHFVTTQQFDALYLRAAMLAGAGQLAGAATLYEAMTVLSPENPLGWVLLAEMRDRLGQRFDEVLVLYRQATRANPDNPGGHYHLGRFLLAHGLYPAALESLRLAHRLAPESDLFLLALLDALELSGARAEALRCIDECRRARPDDATLLLRHAALLFDLGEREQMEQLLHAGLRARPRHPALTLALARVAYLRDDLRETERLLRDLLAGEAPGTVRGSARVLLAEVLILSQRSGEAGALLEDELRDEPANPDLSLMLAANYLQRGLASAVLQVVAPVVASASEEPERLAAIERTFIAGAASATSRVGLEYALVRADHARRKSDWPGVVAALGSVASLADRLPVLHFRRGFALERQGLWREAADAYAAAVAAKPDFWRAVNNHAYLLTDRLQQPTRARTLLEKLPDAVKADPTVADTIAWTAVQCGQPGIAIGILEPLVARMPTAGVVRLHLAHALAAIGEDGRARAELLAAVQMAPDVRSDPHYLALVQRMSPVGAE